MLRTLRSYHRKFIKITLQKSVPMNGIISYYVVEVRQLVDNVSAEMSTKSELNANKYFNAACERLNARMDNNPHI